MSAKKFESTAFGKITYCGKTYDHDIVVDVDGSVRERRKTTIGGHAISKAELYRLGTGKPSVIVIGTGQSACIMVPDNIRKFVESDIGARLETCDTPTAIKEFNRHLMEGKKVAGIFHVTC